MRDRVPGILNELAKSNEWERSNQMAARIPPLLSLRREAASFNLLISHVLNKIVLENGSKSDAAVADLV